MTDLISRTVIFILGMHRSGTSLLAKAVEAAGADLGGELMPPGPDNPKGFWEDQNVFEINTSLLEALNLRWDIPTVVPLVDFSAIELAPLRARAAALLKEKASKARIFAIKDPRLCLVLPFWLELTKRQSILSRYVVAVRNPLDVANSLQVRNGFDLQKGYMLWLNHNYLILRHLLHSPEPLFVGYQQLLEEPHRQLNRLVQFVGDSETEREIDQTDRFIKEFVDKQLCHSLSTMEDVRRAAQNLPGMLELYQCLDEFVVAGWSNERARMVLDKIDPLVLEAGNYQRQLGYFKIELAEKLNHKTQELETEKQAELKWFQRQLERKDHELDRMAQEVTNLVLKLERMAQETTDLVLKNEKEKNAIREENKRELDRLIVLQKQTDEHLRGAIQQIADIKRSLSYRLGRGITWPARVIYDAVFDPFAKYPDNLRLISRLILLIFHHPIKTFRLLNLERLQNAYITFVKKPDTARGVIDYYSRLLSGFPLPAHYGTKLHTSDTQTEFQHQDWVGDRGVSIIIVNHNGRHHLPGLFASLQSQSYQDFELIFVDNGSSDGSVDYVRDAYPQAKIIALAQNVGFAEGNNIGAEIASSRYLCLVNNDMQADPNWLKQLVTCMEGDPKIGAVGPKILFWKKFVQLEIKVKDNVDVWLDLTAFEESLPVYKKWFSPQALEQKYLFEGRRCLRFSWKSKLLFPICEGQACVRLRLRCDPGKQTEVMVLSSVKPEPSIYMIPGEHWAEFSFDFHDQLESPELCYLINNAASEVNDFGEVRDRGFGEPDKGQFDGREEVTALCGGSMLIRREALQGKPVFSKYFFAYYEDTELSLRIRKAGYNLVYCPTSVIYHKHASSSKEDSAFFRYYVNRNRILFLASHYPKQIWQRKLHDVEAELNHLLTHYQNQPSSPEELEFARQIPQIFDDWRTLIPVIESGRFLERAKVFPKIAIYNNFWHTLGGGEHHAGVIAQVLQKFGLVDLISENDFNISELENNFGLSLKFCRKRIVHPEYLHFADATSQYDIFINSTFGSYLKCAARLSYYIVSFPYQLDDRPDEANNFLASYSKYLANSNYTATWIKRWWGVDAEVLYPSIPDPIHISENKQKLILSVGRFFKFGHNKKQLEMVRAFKKLLDKQALDSEWRLVLAGHVHYDQIEYLTMVKTEAIGYPVEFYIDISLHDLRHLYAKSAIYWHATGLNEDMIKHPELCEHFGISTVEAMSYGCVPVVINAGGQREIVEHGINGFVFKSERELIAYTRYCANLFLKNREKYEDLSNSAIKRSYRFGRKALEQNFLKLLESDGYELADNLVLY